MKWNVIVTVTGRGYPAARRLLQPYGQLEKSNFLNVLLMQVADIGLFLEAMQKLYQESPPELNYISRIVPLTHHFHFQSPDEFEQKAKEAVSQWLDVLACHHFYLRMHRRGFKGRLSSQHEECFLDTYLLESLAARGSAVAKVDFGGAERVIALETVGQEAGLSIWTREEIERYPFLKLK